MGLECMGLGCVELGSSLSAAVRVVLHDTEVVANTRIIRGGVMQVLGFPQRDMRRVGVELSDAIDVRWAVAFRLR